MRVLAIPEVIDYMEELTTILYEKEYFGFSEHAHNYVDDLIDDIKTNLPKKINKPAPKHFQRYGTKLQYASFKKNRRTTWYVFLKFTRKKKILFTSSSMWKITTQQHIIYTRIELPAELF